MENRWRVVQGCSGNFIVQDLKYEFDSTYVSDEDGARIICDERNRDDWFHRGFKAGWDLEPQDSDFKDIPAYAKGYIEGSECVRMERANFVEDLMVRYPDSCPNEGGWGNRDQWGRTIWDDMGKYDSEYVVEYAIPFILKWGYDNDVEICLDNFPGPDVI